MTQEIKAYTVSLDVRELHNLLEELQGIAVELAALQHLTNNTLGQSIHLHRRLRAVLFRADPVHPPENGNTKGGTQS